MTLEFREYINTFTELLHAKYKIRIPFRNTLSLVSVLGGKIEERESFDELYDGCIRKIGDKNFIIVVAKNQSPEERNLDIARRLGHLFLHMGYCTNAKLWSLQKTDAYRKFHTYDLNYQANEFAMALLMPRSLFIQVVANNTFNGVVDMDVVAKKFGVSRKWAENRGFMLGLFECI